MIYKILLSTLFLFNFCFASYQEVRIGTIDRYYQDKVTYEELRDIIDEIEDTFESQLNMNVFDYSSSGKPIDIVFVAPSKLEKRISKKIKRLERKKERIERIQNSFYEKQEELDILKSELEYQNTIVNNRVNNFNNYVNKINKKKNLTKDEFLKVKADVKDRKNRLNIHIKQLKREQRKLKSKLTSFNQKVSSYNNAIHDYNRLNKELEAMNRGFRKVKGMAIGSKEVTLKTFYKNGKKVRERSVKNSMNKIEIYGFDTLSELKAILAHEIAHLVGIPHIEEKNALMNPLLQNNQKEELFLTREDIINFRKNF